MKIKRHIIIIVFFFVLELVVSTITCFGQKYLPPTGKTLLIIGQDLQSEHNFVQSGYFPTPGGVTSYCDLYDLTNATAAYPYGGLGEKPDGTVAPDVDWGAGPLNTHNAAFGYSNSTLALGLYMTEQYFPGGLTQIANGAYDTQILRLANFIKNTGKPVFLRIGYECDGTWNTGYNNTTNYKNAFIHIVNTIRPIAPNAMMVLQAATSPVNDIIRGGHENIADWYPGDQYVDYLGYSWFLNVPNQFSQTDELLNLARAHHKPVMVCESTPQGYDLDNLNYRYINTMLGGQPGTNPVNKTPDQIWNEWFQPFFQYIHANSDVIRIVSYINANWNSQGQWAPPYSQGYWGDSRVEVNPTIRQKWIAETTSNFWLHGSSQLFQQLEGSVVIPPVVTPPTISFISPQYDTLTAGENLLVQVNISGNDTITKVALYLNENLVRQATSAPYSWGSSQQQDPALFNLVAGTYILKVTATDKHANVYNKYDTIKVKAISTGGPGDPNPNGSLFPPDGKTLVLIGQTYTQEFQHYVNATQKAPAGSSHYAELYTGKINQGDDANNEAFLHYMNQNYPNAYAELGISFKDNPVAGGYTGENAVWKACKDIVAGKWDTQIDNIAASLKQRPTMKFLVRIDYEVSLGMFANKTTTPFIDILNKYTSQGINPLENANQIPELDLQAYPDAFNYIAKRIREHNNVSNATFIFHPVRGFNDAKWLYPGSQYTDWFGMSMFNDDVCWPSWSGSNPPYQNCPITQSMDNNVLQCLTWAKNTIKKPIIISESAAQSDITNQNSPAFIDGYLDKIFHIIDTFDIKAFVYINSNWVSHGWTSQWGDSRVEKSSTSLQHWLTEVSKSRYIHYAGSTTTIPVICPVTSHTSATTISNDSAWNIAAHASDSTKITAVIFKENGNVLSQDATAPFTFTYTNPVTGNHSIQVITLFQTASCNDTSVVAFTVQPPTTTNNGCSDSQTDYSLQFSQPAQKAQLDINFKSLVNSSFVDVYLSVNNGQTRGIRLSQSQSNWTISLANDLTSNQALTNGNTLTFYFIYQKDSGGQIQTKSYSFVLGTGCGNTTGTSTGGGDTGGGTTTPSTPCSDTQTDYSLQFSQPSQPQLNITFNSLVNSTFVDVYLAVNNEQPRGIRLSQSQNAWTINLNKDLSTNQALTNGEKLTFYFIYQKNSGGQVQTKSYTVTLGSVCTGSQTAAATIAPVLTVTTLYPQPSNGSVTIDLNKVASNPVVSLTNMLGNTSHPGFSMNGTSLQINLNGLQSGNYMLQINSSNGSVTKQIIVSQ